MAEIAHHPVPPQQARSGPEFETRRPLVAGMHALADIMVAGGTESQERGSHMAAWVDNGQMHVLEKRFGDSHVWLHRAGDTRTLSPVADRQLLRRDTTVLELEPQQLEQVAGVLYRQGLVFFLGGIERKGIPFKAPQDHVQTRFTRDINGVARWHFVLYKNHGIVSPYTSRAKVLCETQDQDFSFSVEGEQIVEDGRAKRNEPMQDKLALLIHLLQAFHAPEVPLQQDVQKAINIRRNVARANPNTVAISQLGALLRDIGAFLQRPAIEVGRQTVQGATRVFIETNFVGFEPHAPARRHAFGIVTTSRDVFVEIVPLDQPEISISLRIVRPQRTVERVLHVNGNRAFVSGGVPAFHDIKRVMAALDIGYRQSSVQLLKDISMFKTPQMTRELEKIGQTHE